MADNTFTIGATVDVAQLAAGMNEAGQITKAALDEMLGAFNEASPAAQRAVARITEDTKAAALTVGEDWQRMAKATLAYGAALKELTAATYLARKAGDDDAAATNLLAAAKQKAAAATTELAAAQKAMTVAAEEASAAAKAQIAVNQEMDAASAKRAAALASISDETRYAALSVSAEWQRVVMATTAYNLALEESKAATYLATEAEMGDIDVTRLLAAAKERVAAASIELAEAQKAVAVSNEEVATSAKTAAAAEEELGLSVTGAMGVFSEVFGVVIGVELLKHLAESAINANAQFQRLEEETGITASVMAGLKAMVIQTGAQFDRIEPVFTKFAKAMQEAVNGSKPLAQALQGIGIKAKELEGMTLEEALQRVAIGFAETSSSGAKAEAITALFGKGGAQLTVVLQKQGEHLIENAKHMGELAGVTKENAERAREWTRILGEGEETVHKAMTQISSFALPVVKGLTLGFEALNFAAIAAFDSILATAMTVQHGMMGIGTVLYDVTTGQFAKVKIDAKAAADAISADMNYATADMTQGLHKLTADYDEFFHHIAEPGKEPGGGENRLHKTDSESTDSESTHSESTHPKSEDDMRLEQWRGELQAKKDALDGLHDYSKAEEVKFWAEKLEILKAGTKIYAEVLHQVREADRADQKESLKSEEDALHDRLVTAKQGSIERVTILQEEVNHLKSIGAEETQEYKRNQTELTTAVHAYAEQQGKDAVEVERRKVDATRKGSEERVAAERAVLVEMTTLHLEETSEFTAQLARVTEAERAVTQERVKLQELDIEQSRIVGVSKIELERKNVQTRLDLHLINARQRITALKQLEDQEYEIEKAALERKKGLEESKGVDSSPVESQRIQNQIENLTREHNNRIAGLNTQGVKDSMQKYDQFFSHVSSGFQTAMNGWLQGTQTFARAMQGLWNSLAMAYIQSLEKMLLATVQHSIAKLIVHTATNHKIVISDKTAAAESGSIDLVATLKSITRSAVKAAGKAYSAFADIPIVGPALGAIAAATTFSAVEAFGALASAEGGMVSGQEQLAFLHKNEMVLPAPLSRGFQNIIGNFNGQQPAAAAAPAGGDGGGSSYVGPTHKYGDVHISAFDAKGVADMIHRNQREFTRAAAAIARNGWRPR